MQQHSLVVWLARPRARFDSTHGRRARWLVCAVLTLAGVLEACSLNVLEGLDDPPSVGDGDGDPRDGNDPLPDGGVRDGEDGNSDGVGDGDGDGDAGSPDAGPPPGTSFFSSFEGEAEAPTWLDTAELNAANEPRTLGMNVPMKTQLGSGPTNTWNAKAGAGFTGLTALRYEGSVTATGTGFGYNKVFEVDVDVVASSRLSYVIFPDSPSESDPHALKHPSAYAAVDLAFDDGTYLSDLNATDAQFASLAPLAQGKSRTLISGEWNHKVANIGAVAAGKKIKRILVGYHHDAGPVSTFSGWIDDIRIDARTLPTPTRFADYVVTTRGTNSGPAYSRGNCLPAVATPHGFNLWTPVTNSSEMHWLYHYSRDNNADNLPSIEAFRVSHLPSPWIGDRAAFQVMPLPAGTGPSRTRARRAAAFKHENEIARPYYYSVTFENGIKVEMTPTEHAAMLRFTFPTREATLLFDHVAGEGGLTTLLPREKAFIASGVSASDHAQSAGTNTMYVRGEFNREVSEAMLLGTQAGYYKFDLPENDFTVTLKMSLSFFGREQAERNIDHEIGDDESFEELREKAARMWDEKLGTVRVEGATPDQLTTLYSNLYRLFLYPNQGAENTANVGAPENYKFVSPFHPEANTGMNNIVTGGVIFTGPFTVNHGFWDTFRTAWPLLTLLTPRKTGELIDGFVSHYDAGGWISRWSAPGFADVMTGTSSDVAFADALVKGVGNFDAQTAYEAALKNATVTPTASNVGRKGLDQSIFRGYTSTDVGEGFSWSMAGSLNDFGVANMAAKLAESATGDARERYLEEAEYFRARSLNYANLYDASVGFFQGRDASGAFRLASGTYSPEVWGYDYAETNGWNMAFEAQHDGQGLANLYGGREALATKLDAFFDAPEKASRDNAGSYGGIIHEMLEARDVRMGQLGLSNAASLHIPYMYLFAGQPAKAQEKVRDALRRLWAGSEIGQGYLGDDDNGTLSSWQIFSALGLYPLNVGSQVYVIGSPLFTRATVRLENNRSIVVTATNNSPEHIYVQSLKVNDVNYTRTYLTHDQLLAGARLDFEMGPNPSAWGTQASALPPSLTTGDAAPVRLVDQARPASCTNNQGQRVDGLFDDNASTQASLSGTDAFLSCTLSSASRVAFYTITSGQSASDPGSFRLEGSNNGTDWTTLDERTGQTFPWRRQTRPFKVQNPGNFSRYRLVFTNGTFVTLSELELLAQ